MFLKTDGSLGDLIPGVLLSGVGFYILFHRKRILDALLSSSKVFWDKMGILRNESTLGTSISSFMIPLIGFIFSVVGLVLIIKVTASLFMKH